MKENLYFIALIPDEPVDAEITAFKEDFAIRFNSRKALRVMPHITLKTPFKLPGQLHDTLTKWFRELDIPKEPFAIDLNGFGAFNNKHSPVVYVHPVINTPLYTLQQEITRSFRLLFPALVNDMDLKFNPHITVAYRDLSPENFNEAWKEYKHKTYKAVFEVNEVFLLQHDTWKWNIISSLPLDVKKE